MNSWKLHTLRPGGPFRSERLRGRAGVPVPGDERCRGYPVEDGVRHDAWTPRQKVCIPLQVCELPECPYLTIRSSHSKSNRASRKVCRVRPGASPFAQKTVRPAEPMLSPVLPARPFSSFEGAARSAAWVIVWDLEIRIAILSAGYEQTLLSTRSWVSASRETSW